MDATQTFGKWLKSRRRALDLTQRELADETGCSVVTIRKMEAGDRRPSRQLAGRLGENLDVPAGELEAFIAFARAEGEMDRPQPFLQEPSAPWQAGASGVSYLPAALTPLLGRSHDLAAVRNQLSRLDVRMVTIIGPPGVGKTRLSIAVAGELAPTFVDGVAFVELASIDDVDLVPDAVARTFGIKQTGDRPVKEGLKTFLALKQMLLVLDNFEHLLPAAPLVAELLRSCPSLKVLTTSRAALELSGESRYPLLPLLLPDLQRLPPAGELTRYPSVALFLARAEAIDPTFRLTPDNAPAVAGICARLDGLPLAIELAAARIGLLYPPELLVRLDDLLSLLATGRRDLHDRQQTLRAAINWSYELLGEGQRKLLSLLAVFSGGCTLAAAGAVFADKGGTGVLDGIALLINNSLLVRRQPAEGRPRFFMLETIREFATEKLVESGLEPAVRRRHADYFTTLAETAEPELRLADQATWLARLEREHDNLRAALSWLMKHDQAAGLHLAATLAHFWHVHGHYSEGRGWLARFLTMDGLKDRQRESYAKALNKAGMLAWFQGDNQQALELQKRSVQLWQALEEEAGLAYAMRDQAMAINVSGDLPRARSTIVVSVALFREVGDIPGLVDALFWQGFFAFIDRDYESARLTAAESLELAERIGDVTGLAAANSVLGHVAYRQGDYATALPFYVTSLEYFQEAGDLYGIIVLLGSLMNVSYSLADYMDAKVYADERLEITRRIGNKPLIAESLYALGLICSLLNQEKEAHGYFAEALLACSELEAGRNREPLVAECLTGLASLLLRKRNLEQGALLLGAAERLLTEGEGGLDSIFLDVYNRALTAIQEQLGVETSAELRANGKAMTLDQAINYGLAVNSEKVFKDSI